MIVVGKNPVAELIKSGNTLQKVYILKGAEEGGSGRELLNLIKSSGAPYSFADKAAMQKLSLGANHQGFVAIAEDYKYADFNEMISAAENCDNPLIVALDGIEDPQNLGSIIRVCECAGAKGIIIPQRRSASVSETAIKVSSGAAYNLPVCKVVNLNAALKELKDRGFWVYGADAGGENIYSARISGKTVLVIGGEGKGISRLVAENCDKIVAIPMYGKINSLNAAAACAILVYEIRRQSGF
jgi:23S rRNA (guanosine2251-2'-O)-methyltransferase